MIDHVPLPLDLVDGCRRQRRAAERGHERLPVFDHESAPAPHQQIGPDEVALARLSHSLPLPLEAPRGDADDPVDGELQREDPDHLRAVEDRREDKPHRQSRIGHVGFDVGNPKGILVTRVGEQHGSPGEIRSRVRPGLQVRGEVGAFFQRIDDLEGVVVDEEDVLVAKQHGGPLHPIADGLMNDAVFRIIGALGERGTLTFGPDATLLGEKVVVLEVALSRLRRQILLDHRRPAEVALEFGDELLGIPATQFLVLLRFEGGVFQAGKAAAEASDPVGRHPTVGNREDLIAEPFEHVDQRRRLRMPDALQLLLNGVRDRVAGRPVADPADRQDRSEADGEEEHDQPRLDGQPFEAEHAGLRGKAGEGRRQKRMISTDDTLSPQRRQTGCHPRNRRPGDARFGPAPEAATEALPR